MKKKALNKNVLLYAALTILSGCQQETVDPCDTNDSLPHAKSVSADDSQKKSLTTIYPTPDAIEIVESPVTGVALGWGWNKGDSEPIPSICVEFVPGEEPAQTRYMTMRFYDT